jgi:hypothetical protein
MSSDTYLMTPFLKTIYLGIYATSPSFWMIGLSKTLFAFPFSLRRSLPKYTEHIV